VASLDEPSVETLVPKKHHRHEPVVAILLYCVWETSARTSRLGLWAGSPYIAPCEWRANERNGITGGFTDYGRETVGDCVASMHRRGKTRFMPVASLSVPAPADADSCRIKGNISDSGRIYRVPGSRSYEQTKIDTSKGVRLDPSANVYRLSGRGPKNFSAASAPTLRPMATPTSVDVR
jgi:hypothetical protein